MFTLLGLPSIISSALNFATPLLASLLAFATWYLGNMWDGMKVILANLSTFTVIATVAVISAYYGSNLASCEIPALTKKVPTIVKEVWDPFNVR